MTERHEIVLAGCNPTPLASYLKGLGILRLITDQKDHQATARWSSDTFVLRSALNHSELREFFLYGYVPTPIISPWSGRAGFLEGEGGTDSKRKGRVIVDEVSNSLGKRFGGYRTVLNATGDNRIILELDRVRMKVKRTEKEQKELKNAGQQIADDAKECLKELKEAEKRLKNMLLLSLRSELDERFLLWIDACVALTGKKTLAAPLLGSGGNEGSMDFSINHLDHLKQLIDPSTDKPTAAAISAIDKALFDKTSVFHADGNPGFLNPGVVSGPNMSNGYAGRSGDNPWNTVLMLEGVVMFASAVTKRSNSSAQTSLSFPFMYQSLPAGDGSIYSKEKNRHEFWAPLWNQFATREELRSLFCEGRNTVGREAANDGLDMLRAVKSLGIDRGIQAFQRFGLFERRGKGYYVAAPIGRFAVSQNEAAGWIEDLCQKSNWLFRFRNFTNGNNVAEHLLSLRRKLDEHLFVITSRHPSPVQVQDVLTLLGEIQYALTRSAKARDDKEGIPPVPQLSEQWVRQANDQSTTFRIARALAGLRGIERSALPLRSQLFPIHHAYGNQWREKACKDPALKNDPACRVRLHIAPQRDLTSTLIALLQQRLSLVSRLDFEDKPLNSGSGVDLADLYTFLMDGSIDSDIAALLPGLSLCRIPKGNEQTAGESEIHAAFALCKLALTPDSTLRSLQVLVGDEQNLPIASQLIPKLATGDIAQAKHAIRIAWQRLRGSGLQPLMPFDQSPELTGVNPRRLAASLLIPLNYGATGVLARTILKNDDSKQTGQFQLSESSQD